jgi:hypothetical protein
MAYGLRYTLTQKLRDESTLQINIYDDGYVGDSYAYTPTAVILQPNSNQEDPLGGIISSQLNVSFILSTEADHDNFPDLLNSNDRKYYVEMVSIVGLSTTVKWKGFLFNDYISIGFSTGIQEANFVCVDALSYLKYSKFSFTSLDINDTTDLLSILNQTLNTIQFPSISTSYLYIACSYYANGMNDRGDGTAFEPFSQTYQFRRDFIDLDYYMAIDNIVKSFGCRLFQYNGDWWVMSLNEMVSTNYYTKYEIGATPTYIFSDTITSTIDIEPYAVDNVHFIDNSQTKIIRKGYSTVRVSSEYKSAPNYINNGNFKQNSGFTSTPEYFLSSTTGTGFIRTYDDPSYQYADVRLSGGSGSAQIYMGLGSPYAITAACPYMGDTEGTFTFNYSLVSTTFSATPDGRIYVRLIIGSTTYYLNSDKKWVTTSAYITVPKAYSGPTRGPIESYSLSIPFGARTEDNANTAIGYCIIGLYAGTNCDFRFNNLTLTQSSVAYSTFTATRILGSYTALEKQIDVPYGAIYPNVTIAATSGTLMDINKYPLTGWYRYGKSGTYSSLVELLCRQYSNIFSKNLASLEGDLGTTNFSSNYIYLKDTFTIQDSSTNALSYDGKKFLANRLTINNYNNEINSLQLLEITNTDNASVASINYIAS